MYIPAVPTTPMNAEYVEKQKDSFAKSERPPDFLKSPVKTEKEFVGIAGLEDVTSDVGRVAMGLS